MFYKIYKNKSSFNLFKVIPEKTFPYATRNVDGILLIKIKRNNSITLSSHLQSLNETSYIVPFARPKVLVFPKAISSNLLDPPQEIFLTVTTIKELD